MLLYQTQSSKILGFFLSCLLNRKHLIPNQFQFICFQYCMILPCIFMNIQIVSNICSKCFIEYICSCVIGQKTRGPLRYISRHEISKGLHTVSSTSYCQIAAPTYRPPWERTGSWFSCWDLNMTCQTPHILLNYWAIILQNLLSPTFFCSNMDTSVGFLLSV